MKIIAENIKFKQWNCDVVLDCYAADKSDALILIDHEDSERVATATCCLAGYGFNPGVGLTAIKDYSENEGMLQVLIDAGIVEDTGHRYVGGHNVEFPIVRVLKRIDVDEVAA